MRQFVGIDLGCEPALDKTTVCKFLHLLEEHRLGEQILVTVNLHLQAKGVRITSLCRPLVLHRKLEADNPPIPPASCFQALINQWRRATAPT